MFRKLESRRKGNTPHIAAHPSRYKGDILNEWKKGVIIKLPKKGDLGDCNNWCGITLLSLTSKVFSRIILLRIRGHRKHIAPSL